MIQEPQKLRLQRVRLNEKMQPGMALQYCPRCDWDAERTGGFTWNNCPECGSPTENVKLTNEVMNLMSY